MTNCGRWPVVLTSVLACAWLTGCSTLSQNETGTHLFQESTTQTTSEAPEKLSPPTANNVVDPGYMRTQADFHFSMADALSLDGNTDRAIEEFKLALIYDDKSETVRLRLAAEYVRKGLLSEALDETEQAIKLNPKRVDAHMLMAGLYSAMKTYDKAIAEYELVLKLDAANSDAPVFLGALLAEQKRYDEAISHFQKWANNSDNKTSHLAYYYMGRVYQERKGDDQLRLAEKSYLKSLSLKPEFPEATQALGEVYLSTDRRTEAVKLYRHFQDKYGPNAQIAEPLGRLYMENEDYDNAYKQFEMQEASDSDNLNIKVKMALILIEKHHYEQAVDKLEEILAKAPTSDKIRFYLGAVYEELKRYDLAINQFNQIPIESSFYSEAVIHAAYLHKMERQYPLAISTIRKGISVKPDIPQFYALYASFLDDTKEYRKAVSLLEEATEKFPDNTQLNFFLGSMYDRIRDVAGTIRQMKKVITLDDHHVQALNYLAYTYAEHNMELPEAERLSRQALEFQPNDAYIMDTLGWVLFKQGHTSDAVKMLEVAYKNQPNESIIAEHLGDAYYKSELPEKAREMYEKAVESESDANNKQKLRSKIVSIERQTHPSERSQNERTPAAVHP